MSAPTIIGGMDVLRMAREEAQAPVRVPGRASPPSSEAEASAALQRCSRGALTAVAALKARMPRAPADLVTQAVWAMDIDATPGLTAEDWREGTVRYARDCDDFPTFAGWIQHARDAKAERVRREQREAERAPPSRQIEAAGRVKRWEPGALAALLDAKTRGLLTRAQYDAAVDRVMAGDPVVDVLAQARAEGERGAEAMM